MKLKRYVLGNFKLHQGHFPACETTVVSCTSVRSMVCSAASFEAHNLMPWNSFVSRAQSLLLPSCLYFEGHESCRSNCREEKLPRPSVKEVSKAEPQSSQQSSWTFYAEEQAYSNFCQVRICLNCLKFSLSAERLILSFGSFVTMLIVL